MLKGPTMDLTDRLWRLAMFTEGAFVAQLHYASFNESISVAVCLFVLVASVYVVLDKWFPNEH